MFMNSKAIIVMVLEGRFILIISSSLVLHHLLILGLIFGLSFQMSQLVKSESGSEPEIVLEILVNPRPRPVSRGKILSWEADDEDSESEEAPPPPQLNFPSRGFDQRRYLKQLSTNTKDLDTIEPR